MSAPFIDRNTGEIYWWSQTEGVYIFESGRRVAPRQPIAQVAPTNNNERRGSGRRYSNQSHGNDQARPRREEDTRRDISFHAQSAASLNSSRDIAPAYNIYEGTPTGSQNVTIPDNITDLTTQLQRTGLQAPGNRVPPNTVTIPGNLVTPNTVATRVVNGRPEEITDPALLAQGITARHFLGGTEEDYERLEPSFRKRPRPMEFFVPGKVFLVLWSEPAGNTYSNPNQQPTIVTRDSRFGENIFVKTRRFIVVRAARGYCSCVPILTYHDQGVGKPGVKKSEHAIAYTSRHPPQLLPAEYPQYNGEEPIRSGAIKIIPDNPTEGLTSTSRICFGKVYTIEHNIKAKSYGTVHKDYINLLKRQWKLVWEDGMEPSVPIPPASRPGPAYMAQSQYANPYPYAANARGWNYASSSNPAQSTVQYRASNQVATVESDEDDEEEEEKNGEDHVDDDDDEDSRSRVH